MLGNYNLLFLLLPVAAVSGWYIGNRHKSVSSVSGNNRFPRDYFIGLKYLIDEQPDKAVDVFIKMLEVNSDTVEAHLALGSLFRRRGEVDRAIRIHQNLIARPQLIKEYKAQALAELAQDYLRAGVLGRAENLFLELIKIEQENEYGYCCLLDIYEQQKDWGKAIAAAKKLQSRHGKEMQSTIAHYYCELNDPNKALSIDKNCVRASLLLGAKFIQQRDYKSAVKALKKVFNQNYNFISETITPMAICYEKLDCENSFINLLQECLHNYPRISIVLALAGFLRKHQSDFVAIEFIADQMDRYPSLRGLSCLTEIYIDNSDGNMHGKLLLLQKIMQDLLGNKPVYRCESCGFTSKLLYWYCPSCKSWGQVVPIHGIEGD